jgi:hypothetical protein
VITGLLQGWHTRLPRSGINSSSVIQTTGLTKDGSVKNKGIYSLRLCFNEFDGAANLLDIVASFVLKKLAILFTGLLAVSAFTGTAIQALPPKVQVVKAGCWVFIDSNIL